MRRRILTSASCSPLLALDLRQQALTIAELYRCRRQVERFFSLTVFEKIPLDQLLAQSTVDDSSVKSPHQLILFD